MSVWPSTRSTQAISLRVCLSRSISAVASLSSSVRPSGSSSAWPLSKHFRLEHEAVADDADIGAIAQNGAQAAEEFRTVARQFLHALRQRDVQALAEIGNPPLRFLVALLGASSASSSAASWRRSTLICWFSTSIWASARDAHRLFGFERLVELVGAALGVAAGAASPS